jgi:squalene-hopene/tetraprenyl-beta-curcumene cyclase
MGALGPAEPPTPAKRSSAVPAWDARGAGPLPRQGVACLDFAEDTGCIALGTIAPPGEPNVLLLDAAGNLVRAVSVGQRWIGQVAVDRTGQLLHALCTTPAGRAGDLPTIYCCGQEPIALPALRSDNRWPQTLFHYGDHSNHTGVSLRGYPRGAVALNGNQVLWLSAGNGRPDAQVQFPLPADGITVAMVAGPSGHALVGCGVRPNQDKPAPNLFLLSPQSRQPIWSRPAVSAIDRAGPPENGQYGTPTLPDGSRQELPQHDVEVVAPLSLALWGRDKPRLVAAADYPGWQRWIRSSATLREENYGTRFLPARPTVSLYDGQGKLVRRWAPERFPQRLWVDLAFTAEGKYLLAYPHSWTCRGLAGQSILPADDTNRSLFLLETATGKVHSLEFPDAIADVAAAETGPVLVSCWDGKVYFLKADRLTSRRLPEGTHVGSPALIRVSRDGTRVVIASTRGEVRLLDGSGKELWRRDLNRLIEPPVRPWVAGARAVPIGSGVWQLPGGRVESDLGGQRVVEAPDGLILIEAHAGLSFEREWAALQAVGLDPMRVKYVLATHEHGDHAPGAYLWRVVTGAQFVCSEEMAYTLQHHIPLGTGYGMHPPVPTDLRVRHDTQLNLAGLPVRALRLPGHTYGSMGWLFTRGGKSYIAFGDLIMPNGPLGYSGSINFSGRDVLSSLRKLKALRPDVALPGHGPYGDPRQYLDAGIEVGTRVGWGKFPPEQPDPYFRLKQKNVRVVAWNIEATSAAFGDIDGDGRPDIAVVAPAGEGAVVKIFLNHGGKFAGPPDHVIPLPGVAAPTKIRLAHLNDDKIADILVGGKSAAILLSQDKLPHYQVLSLPIRDAHQVRRADLCGDGSSQIVVGTRFGGYHVVRPRPDGGADLAPLSPEVRGGYADLQFVDLNGDGRTDLVASSGKIYLRQPDGRLPAQPTLPLAPPEANDWTFLAVGDFNGDGRPDVALLSYGMKRTRVFVFYNTGSKTRPFGEKPDGNVELSTPGAKPGPSLLRDAPAVADWNGDGIADLIVGKGQDSQVLVLLGSREGLDLQRSLRIPLDYRLHHETGLHVADFDGDGVPDLACLGYTSTGVNQSGPLAVYLWLQPGPASPSRASHPQSPAEDQRPPKPSADEPLAKPWSLSRAGEFLGGATQTWIRERQCASCHTGYPLLVARASLPDPQSRAAQQVRQYLEDRVAAWDRGGKGSGYLQGTGPVRLTEGITEVVASAATLALDDAQTTGKLHPRTRQALARMWELQRPDGSWAWNKTGLAPLEHDDYFGAVYAAVGVGHAPESYAASEAAREGVARLRRYLQKHPPPDLHHKAFLLWASVKLDGLMEPAARDQAIRELLACQRVDGGWALPSLGTWKRRDGQANDQRAASDGYATGLVVYVLRRAGVPPAAEPIRRGVSWLKTNQRASGRWFTRSVNQDGRHSISNAGTAYAVMALKACDVPG